jgi:hypothetical protein
VFDYTILFDDINPCSCGKSYRQCAFWNEVFSGLHGSDWPERFRELQMVGHLPRSMQIPVAALRARLTGRPPIKRSAQRSIEEAVRVLDMVRAKTLAAVIVDSSKAGPHAWMLARQARARAVVVHLVRDPRAAVFSTSTRATPMRVQGTNEVRVRTRGQAEAIRYWIKANIGAWLLKWYGMPYMRIKYESFVKDPLGRVQALIAFSNKHGVPLALSREVESLLADKCIPVMERHLIGSNPGVKKRSGLVAIKEDRAWLRETPWTRRLLWTMLFLPWLIWFGYPLWPRA